MRRHYPCHSKLIGPKHRGCKGAQEHASPAWLIWTDERELEQAVLRDPGVRCALDLACDRVSQGLADLGKANYHLRQVFTFVLS